MSKREDKMLEFLSPEEKKIYADYARKLKATRDIAIRRQKAERAFWKQVEARMDEVHAYVTALEQAHQADAEDSLPDYPPIVMPYPDFSKPQE